MSIVVVFLEPSFQVRIVSVICGLFWLQVNFSIFQFRYTKSSIIILMGLVLNLKIAFAVISMPQY